MKKYPAVLSLAFALVLGGGVTYSIFSQPQPAAAGKTGGILTEGFYTVGDNYYWVSNSQKIQLKQGKAQTALKQRVQKDTFSRVVLTKLDWAVLKDCPAKFETLRESCQAIQTERFSTIEDELYHLVFTRTDSADIYYFNLVTDDVLKLVDEDGDVSNKEFFTLVDDVAAEVSQDTIDLVPDYTVE